ncbi:type I DNA topoisomerase [Aliarcobacter butzleri]|uniref:type I DNA topoisomerase n=1 Tax=Aliarcobacter butzleri TaxID=28197 RepID=UPI0002295AE5|nr:type I DNA topoisomerase [Aliarcobacter butzleri]MDK2047371.1 type I DNA topoisomerase [Aliarcobacter butzleri]MDK2070093.1 type I DNA topoisomerase [Aliarcobacter butzleri]MDN5068702.1 type I DNA topoisomerase [Aliarcobacter butzleri]MDN5097865.1 type I DNA topoisomerase [Aliarcobacter butzleri]MDN5105741.1 type I DNA topoisomerase [Aliarcobacter butzleri]
MKNLVIVESPAKAKTISKFLGNDFIVMASMGHVRDLPKSSLGFDPNDNFKPKYQISTDKKKVITDLKKHISKDTTIYLAADEDREGEAIAWHLIPALKIEKNPIKRIVFHEITKDAILKALENPRDVDQNLVDAQQARRILDRAVGYELSPLLWKKVRYGLSAGRVQSVAVRIIVDRENEIRAFVPEEYWKIKADFINPELKAELAKENGKTLKISNEKQALEIEASLKQGSYKLVDIEEKESTRNPAAPFTTSTLQQEASRKLGFSVKQTMIIAQQLYEGNVGNIPNHTGGLITYMRTDSLNLSTVATTAAKAVIEEEYGKEYALNKPRVYTTKSKGAQEAHEAIRPVNLALRPSQIKEFVEPAQYRLYSLIWKRTLATQMAQAKIANTTYKIEAGKNKEFEFQVKGQRIIFAGFMKAYTEGSDNPEAALDSSEKILPNIKEGTILELEKLESEQNFTKPPARYTEASLVKKLESEGIGRPSTYAPTISTIQAREYVSKTEDNKLIPTQTGEIVNSFLVDHFSNIVDLGFTAKIEEEFDEIAEGKIAWEEVMKNFYGGFKKTIDEKESSVSKEDYLQVNELGIDPKSGKPVSARVGRFGPFVQIGTKDDEEKPKFVAIPDNLNMDTITLEEALFLFNLPRVVGNTQNGDEIKANIGRFGPYLQVKTKFYSLKTDDPYTIDLNRALEIIKDIDEAKEKSTIKTFDKEKIQILVGQYGPYIKQGRKNFKIPKGKNAEDLTLEECLEIIEKDSKGSTKRTTTKKSATEKKTTAKKTSKKSTDKK